jgi:hypothetical protein
MWGAEDGIFGMSRASRLRFSSIANGGMTMPFGPAPSLAIGHWHEKRSCRQCLASHTLRSGKPDAGRLWRDQKTSLSLPGPICRWSAAHRIGFDGFRWHSRSYGALDKVFKDFVLSRIIENRSQCDHKLMLTGRGACCAGHRDPHPDLSETQTKVVGLDCRMRAGKVDVLVRRAFLYYTLKRLAWTPTRPRDALRICRSSS